MSTICCYSFTVCRRLEKASTHIIPHLTVVQVKQLLFSSHLLTDTGEQYKSSLVWVPKAFIVANYWACCRSAADELLGFLVRRLPLFLCAAAASIKCDQLPSGYIDTRSMYSFTFFITFFGSHRPRRRSKPAIVLQRASRYIVNFVRLQSWLFYLYIIWPIF